ncbi:pseudouridine synthase [Dictyobacter arantiisoli]|uniref:Pseudouridine synthase n=1 Tax=Dictyobacter arantiisoli TaxID=2014874 RepID=A0A5A5TAR2_9CHLR|nr:pseudouridine synthase [Dictyobacter arantiisoli]GCF08335.1 pseudouridine synthase [Dictyobacter arantiisoli]
MSQSRSHGQQDGAVQTEEMRLSRFLAQAGVASRRHAEEYITAGRVQVNGQVVTAQGTRVNPTRDKISVDGKPLQAATQKVYIMLNKLEAYVCTASDPEGRPTVLTLLPPEVRQLRVYPIGRLDIDTSGLLLLTNDGDFALQLTHPRYETHKIYEALVQGHPSDATLERLRHGVAIREDDGQLYQTSPAEVSVLSVSSTYTRLQLTLHEGRKRQIRRMFNVVGHPVRKLMRIGVGDLTLQGVPPGKWRYLTEVEVQQLVQAPAHK